MLYRFFVLLLIGSFLTSCSPEGNVYIDNGGEETMTVVVDNIRHDLQPGQRVLVQLEPGPHRVTVAGPDGKIRSEENIQVVEGGLINAAGAEFLIWKEVFAPQSSLEFRKTLLKPEKLKIDKLVYEVEYTMLPQDQLYIEKIWDLGLEESFPKTVHGWELEAEKQYMFKTLLVRKSDFPEVYMKAAKP